MVIPCFNEEEGLAETARRATIASSSAFGDSYEIIFVDDGSTDHTWELICRLTRQDTRFVGVRLSRNHGHQLALSAGLSIVRGDVVFVLDADLQDPPELLSPMLELMRSNQRTWSTDNVKAAVVKRASRSKPPICFTDC